jgi:hypothetical protein
MKAAEDGIVARAEVDEWLEEQAMLHAGGDFFQMWFFVMVNGTVSSDKASRISHSEKSGNR